MWHLSHIFKWNKRDKITKVKDISGNVHITNNYRDTDVEFKTRLEKIVEETKKASSEGFEKLANEILLERQKRKSDVAKISLRIFKIESILDKHNLKGE